MRLVRPFAVAAVVVGAAAMPLTGLSSSGGPKRTTQPACGLVDYGTGPEVVFGRFKTQTDAEKTRAEVVHEGFVNAAIEADCTDFRVVVRGFDTFDVAVAIQAEARRSVFNPTVECYHAVDKLGEFEVVVGHGENRDTAQDLADHATTEGFRGVALEPDPCGGYEVIVKGATDAATADSLAAEVRDAGFKGTVEHS